MSNFQTEMMWKAFKTLGIAVGAGVLAFGFLSGLGLWGVVGVFLSW